MVLLSRADLGAVGFLVNFLFPNVAPEYRLVHRLARDVSVQISGCVVTFHSGFRGNLVINAENRWIANSLAALSGPGVSRAMMAPAGSDGPGLVAAHLETLLLHQMLEYVWMSGGVELAAITALSPGFKFFDEPLCLQSPMKLSRFAYLRLDGLVMVLESPEAHCRFELTCRETMRWVGAFAQAIQPANLLMHGAQQLLEFAGLLWKTGFLERTDVEEPPSRGSWEFQDLLFHWRSRAGRSSGPQCATYRFLGDLDSPPAVKPAMSNACIRLPVPINEEPGMSLIDAIENRRSVREQGQEPVRLDQIARLLFHSARVKAQFPGEYQELVLRPVPAAGAIHEIEFYVAVGKCQGLEGGLYHYHSGEHCLYRLPSAETHVSALLQDAALAWAKPEDPPEVLIVLASRLPRMAWKYEGIAYRLSLLNAGVIIQSLYLLATEMNLACSAIGGGDSATFAAATGLDPYEETSIAEFAVGSRAPDT